MTDENAEADQKAAGRPTIYSENIVDRICERLSDGESLRSISTDDDMPAKSTVFLWLANHEDFRTRYAHAREVQADAIFDEMLDIADDGRNDWMEKRNSDGEAIGWVENGEALRRSDLRIKTRQWMASKLQPKKYGDKIDLNLSGRVETMTEEQIDARLAQLLGKTGSVAASGGEEPQAGEE